MSVTTATSRAGTDRPKVPPERPRIGVVGITQELYDAMLPGITERQEAYARDVAATLGEIGDFVRLTRRQESPRGGTTVREFERTTSTACSL